MYELLDDLIFINSEIMKNSSLEKILGTNNSIGIIFICNSLVIGIVLYYGISLLISYLTFSQIQKPPQFVFRLILCTIAMNSSLFFCTELINLVSNVSLAIREVGESVFNTEICFSSLINKINYNVYFGESTFNLFSIDGLIKSYISIGFINLAFSYSLRYVMIKVLITICPFAFLTLIFKNTSWFFKIWLKLFLSLLLLQILVPLILLICFSLDFSNTDIFSKFMYVGSIYALIKANNYVRDFMGGISTDINLGISSIKSMFTGG